MISSFRVVLDACVLYPIALCDILLSTADRRLYRPLWSTRILDEMENALVRSGKDAAKIAYRRAEMERIFPDAAITGYEPLIPAMKNDEKDRHVLAAAVRVNAALIVTTNLKDFPDHVLHPLGIRAEHPDVFLMDLLGFDSPAVLAAIETMAEEKTRPPQTTLDILQRIGKNAPKFAAAALMLLEG